jgi:hypothetical protein
MSKMDLMMKTNNKSFLTIKECRLINNLINKIDIGRICLREDQEHFSMMNMMMMKMIWP